MSSSGYGCGPCNMARRTSEFPPVAASEGAKVKAQSLAVSVFGSYGGSAYRLVLLPRSVPAPGSGTRYDSRVMPAVVLVPGQWWFDRLSSNYSSALCANLDFTTVPKQTSVECYQRVLL